MHFHLTIDDQHFPDPVGQEVSDLAAAHSRAMLIARRLMSFCEFERREMRGERWVVTVENGQGRSPMSVIIGRECTAVAIAGKRPSRLRQSV